MFYINTQAWGNLDVVDLSILTLTFNLSLIPLLKLIYIMAGKYYIGSNIKEVAAHHESFQKLWETKWKPLVRTCDSTIILYLIGK